MGKELEYLRILVAMGCPGSSPLWLLREAAYTTCSCVLHSPRETGYFICSVSQRKN